MRAGNKEVAAIDKIHAAVLGLGADMTLASTFADLPQAAQDAANAAGIAPDEFRGVTMARGQVLVVQDNHSSVADLEAMVIHEVYGHIGLRALFGPDLYRRLNKLHLNLGESKVRSLAQKYGFEKADYFDMAENIALPSGLRRRAGGDQEARNGWVMEELLSHIAERETGTIKQQTLESVGAIRDWLSTKGFAALSSMETTDMAYVLKCGQVATQTQSNMVGVEEAPVFSRADIDGLGMHSALACGIGDAKVSLAPMACWLRGVWRSAFSF